MSEKQLQDAVVKLAHFKGFLVAHFERAQVRPGIWVTPVRADAKGFPDLVICGHGRVIFAELKTKTGTLRDEQRHWLSELEDCDGVETYIWRPEDWPEQVSAVLSSKST